MNRRQFSRLLPGLPLSVASMTALAGLARAGAPGPGVRPAISPALAAAVANPGRNPKNSIRDPWRHPAETLAFWGLRPGMTVVEIEPSGGYWTEILGPYLKSVGGVYVGAVGGDVAAFQAKYADRSVWGDMTLVPFSATSGPLVPGGTADLVITARNIHDWMWTPGRLDKALTDFHAALEPGGFLGVEEHRADPRPMNPEAHDGYVATAWLTDAVDKAGFTLAAASEINANPKDTKDHPFGVWTLPPTRRTHEKDQPTPADFNPAKYEAIGESDRMTLRFTRT
jgi:predicted methyltransferase